MQLYERVIKVAEQLAGSQAGLARAINFNVRTFQGYLKPERQDNLWPLLSQILEAFPRLSRQWLYFEEGPMTIGLGVPLDQAVPLKIVAEAVEQMARDAEGVNVSLLQMVASVPLDADASERVKELEQELAEERRLNRQLVTRMLVDGVGDKRDATNIDNKVVGGQG